MNKIYLNGKLVADPSAYETAGGKSMARFRVAVDRMAKDKDGNKVTDFYDVVAWGDLGDAVVKKLKKGMGVILSGELQGREWTDRDGNKKYGVEIKADVIGSSVFNRDGNSGNTGVWTSEEEKPQQFGLIQDDALNLPF